MWPIASVRTVGLQSLERRLERIVEGVFTRRSRNSIRPIELGRRLVREMDEQRSVDVQGRRIVPNMFEIRLNERDYSSFSDIDEILRTELAEAAREYAREEGYRFVGPVKVDLRADDTMKPGRFEVDAQLRQAENGIGVGTLILPSGERVDIGSQPLVVGRMPECDITLSDQNVSRRHAEVKATSRGFVVTDLGSTNGTMVNGVRINGEHLISNGDIVSFGSTYVRVETS
jgi:hypothetical protein